MRRVDRRQCSSSKSSGSSSSLLGRCVLPVFRRRTRNNASDVVTLDTRWTEAPLPPLPNSAAAMVESMSADFTSEHRQRRSGATDRHSRIKMTTATNGSAVRKSRSLHGSSVVALSCLTSDLDVTSTDDVMTLTQSQLLNQQPCLLTQSCHNDDDDDGDDKLRTSINGHHSVHNGEHKHCTVSLLCHVCQL